jgi:hypothetical protein
MGGHEVGAVVAVIVRVRVAVAVAVGVAVRVAVALAVDVRVAVSVAVLGRVEVGVGVWAAGPRFWVNPGTPHTASLVPFVTPFSLAVTTKQVAPWKARSMLVTPAGKIWLDPPMIWSS